ncbi:phosphatase PAP2 family protein [Ruminiclostridium josui]|uniref:phosphatase PAP2 family protein n=1 Tax=Ruminiclostridium josui TaxID=1499 RepID=UPI000A56B6A3|nr:phosphatase PAP2 family protein [Ruminiclostridium josui]
MISAIQYIDTNILNFIQNNLHSVFMDKFMPVITFLGNNGMVWIVIAILLVISKKYRTTGLMLIGALVICLIIGNLTLKPIIARSRPCWVNTSVHLLVSSPQDYSFPSGHTMSSFAAAVVLFLRSKKLGVWALLVAAMISVSRLYLYVHYPSDVAAVDSWHRSCLFFC